MIYTNTLSATSKRGRPVNNDNKVNITDLIVEFLASKDSYYNANICYFKVVDVECNTRMNIIFGLQDDAIRMPFWRTDEYDAVLTIDDKLVNAVSDLVKGSEYVIDISFDRYYTEQYYIESY